MSNAQKFVDFLNGSHSQFHAIANVEAALQEAGFIRLKENALWNLENNRFYYVVKNQSSLIAFKLPEMINVRSINIVASHSDSPALKLKPAADKTDKHYGRLTVEVYGGAILSTWLDRPLAIAGRVTVREAGTIVSHLVDFDDQTVLIPNVAIHQNRQINEGYSYSAVTDMNVLVSGREDAGYLYELISEKLKVSREDILAADLYLYDKVPAQIWGRDREFVSGQRIDNLESVFTSLEAFKNGYSPNAIDMLAIFDREEVGSYAAEGMASSFLGNVINRIFGAFYYSASDVQAVLADSFLLSADNGHAVHPNHPELYDSENQAYMNEGVVIKTAASGSYVNDAVSIAIVRQLAYRAEVPVQTFANRSDSRGGGTQTAHGAVNLAVRAADIGCAQLAMHSCYETTGSQDVDHMIRLMNEFFNSWFSFEESTFRIDK